MAKAKKPSVVPAEKLALYDKAVDIIDGLDRLGVNMPYTASNTHMFSMMTKDGRFGVRLPKEFREKFMEEHGATIFKNNGATIKDYAEIPDHMLTDTTLIADLIRKGWEYADSMKPNPRKKK